jgi:hypothetical protein
MLYLAMVTFLLLLSGFSFAKRPKPSTSSSIPSPTVGFPNCSQSFISGKDHNYYWVQPSDLLVQTFFDSYRIVQTFNKEHQSSCEMASYLLSTCNNSGMSSPLVFATPRVIISRSVLSPDRFDLLVLHTTRFWSMQVQLHHICTFVRM